jgi:hypothetical protein
LASIPADGRLVIRRCPEQVCLEVGQFDDDGDDGECGDRVEDAALGRKEVPEHHGEEENRPEQTDCGRDGRDGFVVALGQREVAHAPEDDDEGQRREQRDAFQTADDGERRGQHAEDDDDALWKSSPTWTLFLTE